MRVVLLSWAKIWDGAARGGGSNGYLSALGLALADRGHDVVYLCGGTTYDEGPLRLVRHADWRGIRVFEVVNSPVLAPSIAQFGDPLGEVSAPELERLVGALFATLRPDVLHVHNLEGFSVGCVDAARAAGARVVFSLHTYHPVCPQVFLVQGHRQPCLSYDNGQCCVDCVPAFDPAESRRLKVIEGRAQPLAAADPARPETVLAPLTPYDPDQRGSVADPRDPRRQIPPTVAGRTWVPLDNVALPEPPSARPPTAYAARRAAMVAMLNRCDAVVAVSRFVRDKYEALGVHADVLSTLYIGTTIAEAGGVTQLRRTPELPVRVAFLGFNLWHKGLPLVADALALLSSETLRRLHLSVFAGGGYGLRELFADVEPRLAGVTLQNGYDQADLPLLLAGIDLGLITSVWWDNAPQTVMELLACGVPVLGARLGGIPDFVVDGHNGLLFRGNDPADLARRLDEVVRDPAALARLRANVTRPKTMREHVVEIEQVYGGARFDQYSPFPVATASR